MDLVGSKENDSLHDQLDEKEILYDACKIVNEFLSQRISELEKENNDLKMDNMTHEYNQAEAEKYLPEYKRQIEEPLLQEIEALKREIERLKAERT